MKNISRWLYTAIIMFILWVIFTGKLDSEELIAGVVISLVLALFTYRYFTEKGLLNLTPKKIFCGIIYFPYLFWEMIKANLDVAYRVIHPKLPIKPGIVKIKTNMKSDLGKLLVANSITLTPGTFTLDIKDDTLYIHWINVQTTDTEEASKAISGRFERCLKRFLD